MESTVSPQENTIKIYLLTGFNGIGRIQTGVTT